MRGVQNQKYYLSLLLHSWNTVSRISRAILNDMLSNQWASGPEICMVPQRPFFSAYSARRGTYDRNPQRTLLKIRVREATELIVFAVTRDLAFLALHSIIAPTAVTVSAWSQCCHSPLSVFFVPATCTNCCHDKKNGFWQCWPFLPSKSYCICHFQRTLQSGSTGYCTNQGKIYGKNRGVLLQASDHGFRSENWSATKEKLNSWLSNSKLHAIVERPSDCTRGNPNCFRMQ